MAEAVGALPCFRSAPTVMACGKTTTRCYSVLVRDRRIRPLKPSGVGIVPTSVHSAQSMHSRTVMRSASVHTRTTKEYSKQPPERYTRDLATRVGHTLVTDVT